MEVSEAPIDNIATLNETNELASAVPADSIATNEPATDSYVVSQFKTDVRKKEIQLDDLEFSNAKSYLFGGNLSSKYSTPHFVSNSNAAAFETSFDLQFGVNHYFYNLNSCKTLNSDIRKALNELCIEKLGVKKQRMVKYANYDTWDYYFTGIPEHIDLKDINALTKTDLIAIAQALNLNKVELKRKRSISIRNLLN